MEILNVGPAEFLLILIIMFILLGPEGMIKTARQIGSWVRQVVRSPMWREIMGYSQEIRELPTKIIRETGLDEDLAEIKKTAQATTSEIQQSVNEAHQEVKKSLEETGSIQVSVDLAPADPPKSLQPEIPVLPVAQTADKYNAPNDGEEEQFPTNHSS